MTNKIQGLRICVHGTDGSIETFSQHQELVAARIFGGLQPARLFAAGKITIAGEYSLTVFVASRITRIDFIRGEFPNWEYPPDVAEVVELSEAEFNGKAHLGDPARMEKREQARVTGVTVMRFVDIRMLGGRHVFLALVRVVDLPVERLNALHFLLSAPALHFRLQQGGVGVLNLANMERFTVYPGPDRAPVDAWPAHHSGNH